MGATTSARSVRVPQPAATSLEQLRAQIHERLRAYGVQSAAVRIVLDPADETRDVSLGFGEAEHDPENAAFHLFSGTKLFTTFAVAKQVSQGKYALDDEVVPLLGDASPFGRAETAERFAGITVRQLLSHTSSLSDSPLAAILPVRRDGDPAQSTAEVLSHFTSRRKRGSSLPATPSYSNVNFMLLGLVVEQAEGGAPFQQAMQDLVLKPLGSNAFFTPQAASSSSHSGSENVRGERNSRATHMVSGYVGPASRWASALSAGHNGCSRARPAPFHDGRVQNTSL